MSLIPLPSSLCPRCGAEPERDVWEEDALFRQGGYGASRRTTKLSCLCGWGLVVEVTEVRPPRGRIGLTGKATSP